MNTTNKVLRSRFIFYGLTQKMIAAEMGINARVFANKMYRRKVNGYEARFTEAQKEWLAARFGIEITDIE